MALSPNYGWSEPDNSSLVKNGAADIRTLGDAIDTSVWNVGFGQAGKNKLINGDFSINQRSFTSTTTNAAYGFDRWFLAKVGGTSTYSAQTFTTGTAPVAGYEATNFARLETSGQSAAGDYTYLSQRIEDGRTFAGQTVTISFWAKAASGTPAVGVTFFRSFGTGGSPSASEYAVTAGQKAAISTSWARYSLTFAITSVSGKTFGTTANTSYIAPFLWTSAGTNFGTQSASLGVQNNTIDIWGVQLEYGSKATPFQTATGTIQGELAACQRYYIRLGNSSGNSNQRLGNGMAVNTTTASTTYYLPVKLRVPASSIDYSTLQVYDGVSTYAATSATLNAASDLAPNVNIGVASGLTAKQFYEVTTASNAAGYIGFSAEL